MGMVYSVNEPGLWYQWPWFTVLMSLDCIINGQGLQCYQVWIVVSVSKVYSVNGCWFVISVRLDCDVSGHGLQCYWAWIALSMDMVYSVNEI